MPWAVVDGQDWRSASLDCCALHLHVDLDVLARGGDADVPEPRLDDVELNTGLEKMHCGRMAHCVRTDALGRKGRFLCSGSCHVPLEYRDYTVT